MGNSNKKNAIVKLFLQQRPSAQADATTYLKTT